MVEIAEGHCREPRKLRKNYRSIIHASADQEIRTRDEGMAVCSAEKGTTEPGTIHACLTG